jgi:phage-related tail fiber protein
MTSFRQSRLADHIDAALTAMAPATAARLTHPDQAQRKSAIAIMAQTLAARLDNDRRSRAGIDATSSPRLPIELQ